MVDIEDWRLLDDRFRELRSKVGTSVSNSLFTYTRDKIEGITVDELIFFAKDAFVKFVVRLDTPKRSVFNLFEKPVACLYYYDFNGSFSTFLENMSETEVIFLINKIFDICRGYSGLTKEEYESQKKDLINSLDGISNS